MEPINQEYFDRPDAIKKARGRDTGGYRHAKGKDGQVLYDYIAEEGDLNGGIIRPKPYTIPRNTIIIRFGGSGKSHKPGIARKRATPMVPETAAGEWWLDWQNYRLVERYADSTGESISYAVSQCCAVPNDWSDLSFLIQAVTRAPLICYKGKGRPATQGDEMIDPQSAGKPDIDQLFIPGLSNGDLRREAIKIQGQSFLNSAMNKKGALAKKRADDAMRARLTAGVKRR